jgi:hypothetical protein
MGVIGPLRGSGIAYPIGTPVPLSLLPSNRKKDIFFMHEYAHVQEFKTALLLNFFYLFFLLRILSFFLSEDLFWARNTT